MDIPEGVTVKVKAKIVEVEGPRGKLTHNFKHLNLDFELVDGGKKLNVFGSRKSTEEIRTAINHVQNLITGVTKDDRHKTRFVNAHSPINARVTNSNFSSDNRNFLDGKKLNSPHRKSSPKGERFLPPGTSSPRANRNNSSNRERSPVKEKLHDRIKSPKLIRQRSPSSSPSPRTKRLRRVQAERETQKLADREHGKNSNRNEQDKGRRRDYGEGGDAPSENRFARDNHNDGSSRSSRRDSSASAERHHSRRHGSRSPLKTSKATARDEVSMSRATEQYGNGNADSVSKMNATEEALEAKDKNKEKPSFELSGKLAEETNRVRGITLLFNEPPDACKPDIRWRLYVFKAGEVLNEPLYVHRQSCYLFGRERRVADIPTDHPSCSKQHAVLQYRRVDKEEAGEFIMSKQIRPYVMDLGSTNGTFINENRIEPQRYYELLEKDTMKFGNSSREYVMLHENSAG